jgi:hypothetical protein
MSEVLNRMAKRAHGLLPAVQPLITSRPTEPGAFLEVVEEHGARSDREVTSQSSTARGIGRAKGEPRAETRPETSSLRPTEPFDHMPSSRTGNNEAMRQVGLGDNSPIVTSELRSSAKDHLGPTGLQSNKDSSNLDSSNRDSSNRDSSSQNSVQQDAFAGSRKGRMREAQIEVRSEQRSAESPSEFHAAPAEERTEIHISIGSIELRAPRTEAGPKPAAFKPRVTLDEFLRGKPGAQP